MPVFADYDILLTMGLSIRGIGWRAERLSVNFGGGYGASALVGLATGLHKFNIRMSVLPDATTNVGQINSKTWFDYYYDFFIDHTGGAEEEFMIFWRGEYWHVKFAEVEIDFERFKGDIYSTGIDLVQVRVPAYATYRSNGSAGT